MGCNLMHCISVMSCLLLLLVLMMTQGCVGGRSIIRQVEEETEKVSVGFYYESLCPYSADFVISGLAPIFSNGLIDIVDLKLYPWGNAKIRPDNSFACQHGPSECFLNTVEACAIEANPALVDHFPFIECVERLVHDRKYTQWETCFTNSNLDSQSVKQCSAGKLGKELELKYAAATDALKPPHEYVPWVVVNGQPLYEDYDNFTSYVCQAYKGTPPSVCSGSFRREKTLQFHPVCYADKPTRTWIPQILDRYFM